MRLQPKTLLSTLAFVAGLLNGLRLEWLLLWSGAIAAAEVWGPASSSDAVDALWIAGFAVLARGTMAAHRRSAIVWWRAVESLPRALVSWVTRLDVSFGVDLRRTPSYPCGVPLSWAIAFTLTLAAAIGAFALAPWMPDGLRGLLSTAPYTLQLAALALLWIVHLVAIVSMGALALACVNDRLVLRARRLLGGGPVQTEWLVPIGVATALAATLLLPPVVAIGATLLVVVLPVGACLAPGRAELALLFRGSDSSVPRRMEWTTAVVVWCAILFLPLVALTLVSTGGTMLGRTDAATGVPITAFLGRALAWTGGAGISAIALQFLVHVRRSRRRDPARPESPVVRVLDGADPRDVARLRAHLDEHGFRVVDRDLPGVRADVPMAIAAPGETESRHAWSLARLTARDGPLRLERLHELVQREHLLTAIGRLFEDATGREYSAGNGFWLAPHLWFVPRLCRDSDEKERRAEQGVLEQIVAPDYADVVAHSARHHLHRILRDLRVDIIFIEDGLPAAAREEVIDTLFDVHDLHAGTCPIEERDFSLVPGVRAVLHDLAPEDPFESKQYPEPDYDEIGRARVLHIFRDRGGEEDLIDVGTPGDRVPLGV